MSFVAQDMVHLICPPSIGSTAYVDPWSSTTLWWTTLCLGFCSSLGFDNGGTHTVHCWTIHLLFLLCHSVSHFSLSISVDLHPGVFPCACSASLAPGQHLVLDPARMQKTVNGMVNSPWRSVASHCKHRQALLGALAICVFSLVGAFAGSHGGFY